MARIQPIDPAKAEGAAAARLAALSAQRGYVPNLYATLAHSPALLEAFMGVVEATRTEMELNARLRELAILAIARETGATIQWLSHLPLARDAGLTASQVASLGAWPGSPEFAGVDRAVLEFAREVAFAGAPSDNMWDTAAAFLGTREMIELTFICAFYSGVSRILNTLQVAPDPEYLGPARQAFA